MLQLSFLFNLKSKRSRDTGPGFADWSHVKMKDGGLGDMCQVNLWKLKIVLSDFQPSLCIAILGFI